ncbi:MAG: hypothetical protein ABIB61_03025 [Candidatus Shapirobacteria bacterium]
MKKIFLSVIISLVVGLGVVSIVRADDGGPNITYWVKDNKITCLSVINPENLKSDFFFLFDYSQRVGENRGKPWVILEKGKCYEIDDEGGNLYRVQIINGKERQQYSDYAKYKPTDDITASESIVRMWPYEYRGLGVTRSADIHFTGITANSLFPTKYDFGIPITAFISSMSEEEQKISNDQSYLEIKTLYTNLAKQLESTIKSCDTRIRVEHQLSVTQYNDVSEKNIIWKLGNNRDFSFDATKKLDPLSAIELMGCKASYGEFINSHKTDFNTIDRLSQEVINKYPDAVAISGDYGPIQKRDDSLIKKILAFISTNEPVNNTPVTTTIENSTTATPLDEPTPEKKIDLLVNSKNPLMRVYVYLPILALVGIIIFFLLKKRQK